MNIRVVDYKNNEVIKIKIELNQYMFIVVPEIINHNFDYLKPRLMNIRTKYMNMYLDNKELFKTYEQEIYNEMRETLIDEMTDIHRTEGIMYYTV